LLDEELQLHIQTALSIFSELVRELMEGSVLIQRLEWIIKNKNNLLKVQKVIEDNEILPAERAALQPLSNLSQILTQVMSWRETELKAFRLEKQILMEFISMCRDIQGGLSYRNF
jgi:hypothetical protein